MEVRWCYDCVSTFPDRALCFVVRVLEAEGIIGVERDKAMVDLVIMKDNG